MRNIWIAVTRNVSAACKKIVSIKKRSHQCDLALNEILSLYSFLEKKLSVPEHQFSQMPDLLSFVVIDKALVSNFVFNSFSTNVPLLEPLKISEKRRFSDVFRGYRSGALVEHGLTDAKIRPVASFTKNPNLHDV